MEFLTKHKFNILLLFLLSVPALLPLFHNGFFQSDDGEWMIIRFSAFHQALADGQFPARFLHRLNYGYGYPVADFLYPGFMYLGETLKLMGFEFVAVIKLTIGICLLESVIFSYFWLVRLFGKWPAFLGSLVYLYSPYHLFDVYKRGSVGEVLALATVPFIFWQIERKSVLWTSLGVALLILSHNTLAVLFLPIIIGYGFLRHSILYTLYFIFYGLGLSAFFWLPALYDLQYTVFGKTEISQWAQYFSGLDLIGLLTIFIIGVSFIILRKKSLLFKYFLFCTVGSIFLASSISESVWNMLPVSFVQFPFRFLSITIFSVSFLCAFILSQFQKKQQLIGSVVIIVLLIFSARNFIAPSQYFDKGNPFYATNEATTTVRDEYMPKWVVQKPTEHFKNKVEILEGEGKIKSLVFNNKKIHFDINMENSGKARINTIYFPGWKAYVDGKEINIDSGNKYGVMDIPVTRGENEVKFTFSETPIRLFSDVVSLLSLLVLVFTWARSIKNKI